MQRKLIAEDYYGDDVEYNVRRGQLLGGYLVMPIEDFDYGDMYVEGSSENLEIAKVIDYSTGPVIRLYEKIDKTKRAYIAMDYIADPNSNIAIVWD